MIETSKPRLIRKTFSIPPENAFKVNDDGSVSTVVTIMRKVDDEGDIFLRGAWSTRENISLLAHHDHDSDPIGRVDAFWEDDIGGHAAITFHPPSWDPRGAKYGQMAQFGSLKTISPGFRVIKATKSTERSKNYSVPLDIESAVLWEISFTPMPANDESAISEENLSIKRIFLGQCKDEGVSMSKDIDISESAEVESAVSAELEPADDTVDTMSIHQKSFEEINLALKSLVDSHEKIKASIESIVTEVVDKVSAKMFSGETAETEKVSMVPDNGVEAKDITDPEVDGGEIELTAEQFDELVAAYAKGLISADSSVISKEGT